MDQHSHPISTPPVVAGGPREQDIPLPGQATEPSFAFHDAPEAPAFSPVRFTGSGRELFVLYAQNLLYTLLTLGLYSFWGKVRIRRYLWGNTLVLGEPLEYAGTGGELFRSFFIVLLLVTGLGIFYYLLEAYTFSFFAPVFSGIVAVPLAHLGTYQAIRYRLTRTLWQGVHGNLAGSSLRYAFLASGYSLLSTFTGGLLYPLQKARLIRRSANAAFFGDKPFVFAGSSGPLYKALAAACLTALAFGALCTGLAAGGLYWAVERHPELQAWLLELVTEPHGKENIFLPVFLALACAGLATFWFFAALYTAAFTRWFFRHLSFGQMRLSAPRFTGRRFLLLTLGNFFLAVLTCGLGLPWATIRAHRFAADAVRAEGDPQLDTLGRNTQKARSSGEGLLDALNVDLSV